MRVIPDFENLPPMTKSKALKVFQKMVLATIAGNLMLGRKGYMKKQRQLKLQLQNYPENIRLIHEKIRVRRVDWNKFFEDSMVSEKMAIAI